MSNEIEDLSVESDVESSKEVVVRNTSKSQNSKKQFTEAQKIAQQNNLKKAHEKRSQLKPVNQQAEKDKRDLKTLERLVRAKEMAAKKSELMARLLELDDNIETNHTSIKKKKSKPVMEEEASIEEVVVKKPKKKIVRRIVEEEPSVEEVVVKKPRKPRTTKPKQNNIQDLVLKSAIEKQTNQLLYNQLFGL